MTISGTAQVGQTLSAAVQPEGATVSYKWKRSDTADGAYTDIPDAISASYELQAEDEGKYIKAEASGTGEYTGTVLSAATAAVAAVG